MDYPDLSRGWWAVEQDGPMMSRWTDGEAVLSLPATLGPVLLEIHLAGAMTFVEGAMPKLKAELRDALPPNPADGLRARCPSRSGFPPMSAPAARISMVRFVPGGPRCGNVFPPRGVG